MNLANRITFSRLILIPVFMLFSTSLPGYIDKSLNLSIFSTYGIYIAAFIFALAALTRFPVDVILLHTAAIVTVYSGIHYFKVNWHVFSEGISDGGIEC